MKPPIRSTRGAAAALGLAFVTAVLLSAALPSAALASAPTWMVPAGGETWTAGTHHTIEWSGGGANATIFALVLVEVANPALSNWVTVGAFCPVNSTPDSARHSAQTQYLSVLLSRSGVTTVV